MGGEFIAYAKSDPNFPDAKTWGGLRRCLNGRGATHETVVAARLAWKDYRQQLKSLSHLAASLVSNQPRNVANWRFATDP